MLGTVYIRDINFVFQNFQSNANIFGSHGLENRSFFFRSFVLFFCMPFCFLPWVYPRILRLGWKAKLKPREIATLPLQEVPAENIQSNSLSNIC